MIASLNRPGGNVTGVTMFTTLLTPKRLELLREVVPRLAKVALLINATNPNAESQVRELRKAAHSFGMQLDVLGVSAKAEIDGAFAGIVQQRAGALIVSADPFLSSQRDRLVLLAARHAIPAIYQWRDFTARGGL